ncbi:MAG: PorV/PorQ family protein [Owenweeksia sp.]|nr:PorV/PorQ family protein [Owenweeksia sp.]
MPVVSNVGAKISYGNEAQSDFIPTNLRLGGAYNLEFDQYNRMSFYLDFNKLLVPTPPVREGEPNFTGDANDNGEENDGEILFGEDDDVNAFQGVFQSFGDAPGGFNEEVEEVLVNVGVEYWYDNNLAVRGGYQYEDQQKGGRQYFTMGLGIRYNVFGLDFAYLIPASATVKSPLENTLRFTLIFNFQDFEGQ